MANYSVSRRPVGRQRLNAAGVPYEADEQAVVVAYAERKGWPIFAVPNEGRRTPQAAAKALRLGLKAGVPDLVIPVVRDGGVLFIEIKPQKGGCVTEKQKFWHEWLTKCGHTVVVAKGAEAAIAALEEHINGSL